MTNIYIVERWGFSEFRYEVDTVAIWLDKQVALDYAANYDCLDHLDLILVKEQTEGEMAGQKSTTVYKREYIDHTQVLFDEVEIYTGGLTKDEFLTVCKEQAPSLVNENVDVDRLYAMYNGLWEDYDD